ncbi:hypothetical protein NITMOv2_2521 [Nitrospira moscoviensis]|uniref:Uncharacterized protein n=1 Tax=Nitrospira moscoviensis TaxID=42253 RepID=A0A0K2GDL3_NITMO|nr:hypothetical protein NITMOv2_2521 [Nitrospira moscoviensis]
MRPRRVSQCGCKTLELLELTESLFDSKLQVLPQQCTINVAFVEFDDGVRRGGVGIVNHGGSVALQLPAPQ